ncbi:anaphase-promoting protein [Herbaspirillum sp. alder98]|uniref:anaphase-promoting protein n=1 Tax=Herbaspirillum sp. alder98 TaxID=2913096 RepID=UPI001CD8361B|nr:anaphase-promoting protein [Herbaspirillum sp. alder98]MCA1322738.1 anaphase-promoting protein [Herbaspirillum sp. alder98]
MSELKPAPRKISLPFSLFGLAAAVALALWAGNHYMRNEASLFYGLAAGLSFGAAFAFGQQIKNHFVPPRARKSSWKVEAPGAAGLSPAKLAAQAARKINVEFDDQEIRTTVRGTRREGIAWSELSDITIRISEGDLPEPQWIIAGRVGDDIKGVLVPNDAEGLDALMDAFKQRLPGFSDDQTYQTIIAAMSALEGSFHIWSRKPAT